MGTRKEPGPTCGVKDPQSTRKETSCLGTALRRTGRCDEPMTATDLLKTIYLGDRGCKAVLLDGWNSSVSVHATVISRIRSESGHWDYYMVEDIVDGRLVFTGVSSFRMTLSGPLPNDFINDITAKAEQNPLSGVTRYTFALSISSVDAAGTRAEITIEIVADDLHLEDPAHPGVPVP